MLKRNNQVKTGESQKLRKSWKGPYVVTKVINDANYEIKKEKKIKIS